MRSNTIWFGLTLTALVLAMALTFIPMEESDGVIESNTFERTTSELWFDNHYEYTLTNPVHIHIIPDFTDGYHYSVQEQMSRSFDVRITDGAVDSLVSQPGYVNLLLVKELGGEVVDVKTIVLKTIGLSPTGSLIYGSQNEFSSYFHVTPAENVIDVGDSFESVVTKTEPTDDEHYYFQWTEVVWRAVDSSIIQVTPKTSGATSYKANVTGLSGGSTQIEVRMTSEYGYEGQRTTDYNYGYADVTVVTEEYTLTMEFRKNAWAGGTYPSTANLPATIVKESSSETMDITIPSNDVTMDDYVTDDYTVHYNFQGYSQAHSDSTATYLPGETYSFNAGSVILYPIFNKTYTYHFNISFKGDGASNLPSALYKESSTAALWVTMPSDVPTKEGYIFSYWTHDYQGQEKQSQPGDRAIFYYGATDVTANFVPAYTVSIQSSDTTCGTVSQNRVTVAAGTEFSSSGRILIIGDNAIVATANNGYEFDSWSPASGTISDGAQTITANFKTGVVTYHITVQKGNWGSFTVERDGSTKTYTGSTSALLVVEEGKTLKVTWYGKNDVITNYPYYTDSWTYTKSCTKMATSLYGDTWYDTPRTATADTTWYPAEKMVETHRYLDTKYILEYDANGGTGAPAKDTIVIESQMARWSQSHTISSTEPTRDGYQFEGWATKQDATTAAYQPGDSISTPDGVTTLYAVWGTETIYPITIHKGDYPGFYATVNYTSTEYKADTTLNLHSGDTLSVMWSKKNNVIHQFGSYSYESTYQTCRQMSETLYSSTGATTSIMVGEYSSSDYYPAYSAASTETKTYTMKYNIYFDANGGTGAPATINDTLEASSLSKKDITMPTAVPTYTDRTFLGWAKSTSASTAQYQPGQTYSFEWGDTYLIAVWGSAITVSFYVDGSLVNTQNISDSSPYITYQAPSKTGKVFIGWFDDQSKQFDPTQPVTKSMKLTARYVDSLTIDSNPAADGKITRDSTTNQYIFDSTGSGNGVIKVEWDFGDQSEKSSDAIAYHTYVEPGTYNVKLKVWYQNGFVSEWSENLTVEGQGEQDNQDDSKQSMAVYALIGVVAAIFVLFVIMRVR